MRYVYAHLGSDWAVTILATDVQERSALSEDAILLGAELILLPSSSVKFLGRIVGILAQDRHDLIQSHGFTSAIIACIANILFRRPHVLTVHGILEERLLGGVWGRFRHAAVRSAILSVDAVYGVSEDILMHVRQEIPGLVESHVRQVAILNGIDPGMFLESGRPGEFRRRVGIAPDMFLFGFLGRFMPQKGFDRIIEALALLEGREITRDYVLVAVGSGDCLPDYECMAKAKGVEHRITFVPFQQNVAEIYRDLDAVLMPSNWEACPLQPMEAMVSGVPIITSDCIGLREVVRNTPAIVVPGGNSRILANVMLDIIQNERRSSFIDFQKEAVKRFDVRNSVKKIEALFYDMVE